MIAPIEMVFVEEEQQPYARPLKRAFCVPLAFMKWPILALSPRTKPKAFGGHEHGVRFEQRVIAYDAQLGPATLEDLPLLSWISSTLVARMDQKLSLGEPIEISPAEFLKALGRPGGGRQYELLEQSLRRLAATEIMTDLAPGGRRNPQSFTLLGAESQSESRSSAAWSVTCPDWLSENIHHRQFARVDSAFWRHRGLSRRVACWCHGNAGGIPEWQIPLSVAYAKSGSTEEWRKFKSRLKELIARNPIPGFDLSLGLRDGKETFVSKRRADPQGLRARIKAVEF